MAHVQDPSSSNWSYRPPSPTPCFDGFSNVPLDQPFSETLCGNYLSMLAQQPSNSGAGGDYPSTTSPPVYGGGKHEQDPAPGAGDLYYEWCNEGDDDRSRYLTSPHTPLYSFTGATPSPSDTPLVTPDMGVGMDIQGNFQDSDVVLFGGLGVESVPTVDEYRPAAAAPKLPPTDHLWTLSPSTPAVDSFEPVVPASDPVIPYAKKRRASASKKVVAFVDDEEEEEEEGSRLPPPPPTASEAQKIEYKRQMNTLAARRSRRRKAQHLQALEEKVKMLEAKRVMWRENALTVQKMLKSRGIDFPFDEE